MIKKIKNLVILVHLWSAISSCLQRESIDCNQKSNELIFPKRLLTNNQKIKDKNDNDNENKIISLKKDIDLSPKNENLKLKNQDIFKNTYQKENLNPIRLFKNSLYNLTENYDNDLNSNSKKETIKSKQKKIEPNTIKTTRDTQNRFVNNFNNIKLNINEPSKTFNLDSSKKRNKEHKKTSFWNFSLYLSKLINKFSSTNKNTTKNTKNTEKKTNKHINAEPVKKSYSNLKNIRTKKEISQKQTSTLFSFFKKNANANSAKNNSLRNPLIKKQENTDLDLNHIKPTIKNDSIQLSHLKSTKKFKTKLTNLMSIGFFKRKPNQKQQHRPVIDLHTSFNNKDKLSAELDNLITRNQRTTTINRNTPRNTERTDKINESLLNNLNDDESSTSYYSSDSDKDSSDDDSSSDSGDIL